MTDTYLPLPYSPEQFISKITNRLYGSYIIFQEYGGCRWYYRLMELGRYFEEENSGE